MNKTLDQSQAATVEQATATLARIWVHGGFCDAGMAIQRVIAQSKKWNWSRANSAMSDAYRALGVDAPVVSVNAIHKGEHPVQVAAAKIMEE